MKRTPLYDAHVKAGAKITPFAGFEMPLRYTGDVSEHLLVREKAGLFDVSHMGEFLVRGPQALPLIQYVTTNDVSKIPVGKAQYNCLPNAEGGVIDDLIVYRLEEELYLIVVNASNVEKDWNWIAEQNKKFNADLTDISEETALLALSGPLALQILKKLTDSPIENLGYYASAKGSLCGIDNILFATTGYTGERTYEIFVRNENALQIWEAIIEAGQPEGVQPTGLACRDTLRLEMGYMLYGNELNDTVSPLEAGLGWITKLDKGDFISADFFRKQKADGLKRKLIHFVADSPRDIPRGHYALAVEGKVVGEVSSGAFSPSLKQGIGMGLVDAEFAKVGGKVDLVIRDAHKPATIVKAPFISETSLTGWK